MTTGGYCPYYRDLKDRMIVLSIRYSDIAKASGYAVNTITEWLRSPERENHAQVIEQAIERIEFHRQNGRADEYTPKPTTPPPFYLKYNRDLRVKLKSLNISHGEVARILGLRRQTITRWIGEPLTTQREEAINHAVNCILNRRH